jgi:dipeptidyl aminopeptidase/acylaminoacyl peptidase
MICRIHLHVLLNNAPAAKTQSQRPPAFPFDTTLGFPLVFGLTERLMERINFMKTKVFAFLSSFAVALLTVSTALLQIAGAQQRALEITDVTYTSEDGKVAGKIYRLKELSTPAPAIVVLPGRGRDFEGLEWLIKPLAEKGYVVMPIGYRGIPVRYYLKDVEDARNAITYLESLPYVDRSRIGIFGHSRGGMAALMSVASGDKRIKSVVSASAPTDHFKSVAEHKLSVAHYPDRMRTRGGPPEEDPVYYRSISPIFNADKMRDVPILLIHGAADFLSFVDHSLNMYGALKVAGNRDARIEVIVGAGHFFERGSRGYLYDEVIALTTPWFDNTLKAKTQEK